MKVTALETTVWAALNPGHDSVGAPFYPIGTDSARVRPAKDARLVALCHYKLNSGFTRITSPLLHDTSVGIKLTGRLGFDWLYEGCQQLTPGDVLQMQGSGRELLPTGHDYVFATIAYDGVAAGTFRAPDSLCGRIIEYTSVPIGYLPTEEGVYTGEVTLEDLSSNLKYGSDYVVIGVSTEGDLDGMPQIGIRAPDWGNLRIGIPAVVGNAFPLHRYFLELSERTGMGLVPQFRADNNSAIVVDYVSSSLLTHLYADLILGRVS